MMYMYTCMKTKSPIAHSSPFPSPSLTPLFLPPLLPLSLPPFPSPSLTPLSLSPFPPLSLSPSFPSLPPSPPLSLPLPLSQDSEPESNDELLPSQRANPGTGTCTVSQALSAEFSTTCTCVSCCTCSRKC